MFYLPACQSIRKVVWLPRNDHFEAAEFRRKAAILYRARDDEAQPMFRDGSGEFHLGLRPYPG